MPRPIITLDKLPLYPTEDELARAILGSRAREWPSIAVLDERKGLPKIDPVRGGRYRPAVQAFYDKVGGLGVTDAPRQDRVRVMNFAPDGEETPDAEKQAAVRGSSRKEKPPAPSPRKRKRQLTPRTPPDAK
jgi:hypothetical protein